MAIKAHIRRDDVVVARQGRSAGGGRTGKVLYVDVNRGRAIVEGMNLVKKCLRKSEQHPEGGISEREAPMPLCKLQLYCPQCKKGVRVGRVTADGRKLRKCKGCTHLFD